MKKRNKVTLMMFGFLLLCLMGCGKSREIPSQTPRDEAGEVLTYSRKTEELHLAEGYHPNVIDYGEEGIFYYVPQGDSFQEFTFYFQTYGGEADAERLFDMEGGYMRDLSAVKKEDGMHYAVLHMREKACISEFDAQGKNCREFTLANETFAEAGKFPMLLALSNGDYLIGLENKIYLVQADGNERYEVSIEDGNVRNLVALGNGRIFAIYEKKWNNTVTMFIAEVDMEKGRVGVERSLPATSEKVSVFAGEQLVYWDNDFAYLFDMDETKDEKLIDLKKQSILSSQIQGIYGTREEILVVSVDSSDRPNGMRAFHLVPKTQQDTDGNAVNGSDDNGQQIGKTQEKKRYAEDGRRILRVAISNEEYWPYEVMYRAQKYSQDSDIAVVEVERFDGTVEDYLGRGERPDVIMLYDQAEIAPLVELGALADLNPLYEKQEKYSLEDLLPKVKEALSVGDGLYAMANTFQLLLCTSDGTENDARGNCNALAYLRWYDDYLARNEVTGMEDLNQLFFGVLPSFYDEGEGKAYFASEDFKELMTEYKKIKQKYPGKYMPLDVLYDDLDNMVINRIVKGPVWCGMFGTEKHVAKQGIQLAGIPDREGGRNVYMELYRPLAILDTSECKEEALDFILYSYRSATRVGRSTKGDFDERDTKQQYNTDGVFWAFDEYLKEEIWETQKPCWCLTYEKPINGYRGVDLYITDEHKEMLQNLMDQAVGVTKAQNDVYGMFLEEMDAYVNGNKDLDSCCDILQNRVSLYLKE